MNIQNEIIKLKNINLEINKIRKSIKNNSSKTKKELLERKLELLNNKRTELYKNCILISTSNEYKKSNRLYIISLIYLISIVLLCLTHLFFSIPILIAGLLLVNYQQKKLEKEHRENQTQLIQINNSILENIEYTKQIISEIPKELKNNINIKENNLKTSIEKEEQIKDTSIKKLILNLYDE